MSGALRISPARRLVALKALPGFGQLPTAQVLELGARARVHVHDAGATLQRGGLVPHEMHLVMAGTVTCTRDGKLMQRVEPFELVGGLEVLAGDSVAFAAVADERVVTLSLEVAVMRAILADNFAVFLSVVADVARRISSLRQRARPPRGDQGVDETAVRADTMVTIIAALLEVPELVELPVDVLAVLASQAHVEAYPAGARLWRRAEPCRRALLLLQGRIDCSDEDAPVLGRRRLWGLEEALSGGTRATDATAATDVKALVIEERVLLDELEDDSTAALAFLQALLRLATCLEACLRLRDEA